MDEKVFTTRNMCDVWPIYYGVIFNWIYWNLDLIYCIWFKLLINHLGVCVCGCGVGEVLMSALYKKQSSLRLINIRKEITVRHPLNKYHDKAGNKCYKPRQHGHSGKPTCVNWCRGSVNFTCCGHEPAVESGV